MKNISRIVFIGIIAFVAIERCSAQWHVLTQLSPRQKSSSSYKFLSGKFGAGHLLVDCDPEEAAGLGGEYLIQIMSVGDGTRDGETVGHGATLQQALNDAAYSYISPAEVRRIRAYSAREQAEEEKRAAVYRKKCCGSLK